MFTLLKPFVCPNVFALKFAIKLSIASGTALFLAFCLDLDQPKWAAATAVIVAQPYSGMVISKGLARLLGTVLGTFMALIVTALFCQTPWLFIFALAIGLTFCTAASTVVRSAWSYSFVLGGYTTAIIVLPNLYNPSVTFDYAIARCTEISIGIVCSSFIFGVLWPVKIYHDLVKDVVQCWRSGLASACAALKGDILSEEVLNSLSEIIAVDTQREHAAFEGGDGQKRAYAVQAMIRNILGLLRVTRGVSRQLKSLPQNTIDQLQPWLEECIEKLTIPTYKSLHNLAHRLYEAGRTNKSLEQQDILARLELAIQHAIVAGLDLSAVRSGHLKVRTNTGYLSIHRNYSLGLFFGLRSGFAFLTLATFWMIFGWPITEASGALMMVAVTCSVFANRENATQTSLGFFRGTFYGCIVAFISSQLIAPSWSGFPLLWITIGVPLFFGALGMTNPAITGTCTIFSINFIMLCKPLNHGFQGAEDFINQAMAMLAGIFSACIAFNLVKFNSPYWQGKYMLTAMLRDLKKMTQSSLGGIETWFGGRMADRLILLARHKKIMAEYAEERWNDALHAIDIGDELLHLRNCLNNQKNLQSETRQYLQILSEVFDKALIPTNASLLDEASEKLKIAIIKKDTDMKALLALSSIKQLQQIWSDWCHKEQIKQGVEYGAA